MVLLNENNNIANVKGVLKSDVETVLISIVGTQKSKMPTDGATTTVDVAVSLRKVILSFCL